MLLGAGVPLTVPSFLIFRALALMTTVSASARSLFDPSTSSLYDLLVPPSAISYISVSWVSFQDTSFRFVRLEDEVLRCHAVHVVHVIWITQLW